MANYAYGFGGEVATVKPATGDGQIVGGVYARGQMADTQDVMTYRVRADGGFGGNGRGIASRLSVDAEAGYAVPEGPETFFVKGGLHGTLARDPATGLFALEVPTLWLGFQHHGERASDPWHLDVGPRASLAVVGRAFSDGAHRDFVAAPTAGAGLLLMGQVVTAEAVYTRIFETSRLETLRGSVCLAYFVQGCVDTRQVWADFGPDAQLTSYVGFRLGLGWATGVDHHLF